MSTSNRAHVHSPTFALEDFADSDAIPIGCDTEFDGVKGTPTLTAQFATRVGDTVIVQLYHLPHLTPPSPAWLRRHLKARFRKFKLKIVVRPFAHLDDKLTPSRILRDLFGCQLKPTSAPLRKWRKGRPAFLRTLKLRFIGHYLEADLLRIFGAVFYSDLLKRMTTGELEIGSRKPIQFRKRNAGRAPGAVLEHARCGRQTMSICVEGFDTLYPFGRGSLDDLAKTFLGMAKDDRVTHREKQRMEEFFRRKPKTAFAYAAADAVLPLLLEARMAELDAELFQKLGLVSDGTPIRARPTMGGRAVEYLSRYVEGIVDSAGASPLSKTRIRKLLSSGSGRRIAERSRFGGQTGATHGGLCYSRTPMRFFHDMRGHGRDVDLQQCYASIIAATHLFLGEPVVLEPGNRGLTLKEAVEFLQEHAAGKDSWIIRVSGTVKNNSLILSTADALTHENYRKRAARERARTSQWGFAPTRKDTDQKPIGTFLFSDVIESGVIAWSTWLMIKALPEKVRRKYEELEVETILFHPRKLVADDRASYDELVREFRCESVPWEMRLDVERLELRTIERLTEDHVTLRVPLAGLLRPLMEERVQARQRGDFGTEKSCKELLNSFYGIMASARHCAHNVIAANYITATGRAIAFGLMQALNGFQVVTDGCTYRRDQIPAGSLADVMAEHPRYLLQRPPANNTAFLDSRTIPEDDLEFSAWCRGRLMEFFGVTGKDYEWLFGLHSLAHKTHGSAEEATFDGLICDGASNYLKLQRTAEGWSPVEHKARGFGKKAKKKIAAWLMATCIDDRLTEPAPLVASDDLLGYTESVQQARSALQHLARKNPEAIVLLPLGLSMRRVRDYRLIKPSQFVFRTPKQRRDFCSAWARFTELNFSGPEILALRRESAMRRHGSVKDLVRLVVRCIRQKKPFRSSLNLARKFVERARIRSHRSAEMRRRKRAASTALRRRIDASRLSKEQRLRGMFVSQADLQQLAML